MGPKNVVVSAFTRLRASNLDGTTTKIYHRIRNVKNAERNEKRERKGEKKTRVHTHAHRGARRRKQSGAGREADARQLCVVEGSRALILNPG